jgi:hypothetical protein
VDLVASVSREPIDLSRLRAARAAMTAMPWMTDCEGGVLEGDAANIDGPVPLAVFGDEAMRADAVGIVAIVEAIDALIEIVELDLRIERENGELMACLAMRDEARVSAREKMPELNVSLQALSDRVEPLKERRRALLAGVKL